MYHYRIKEDWTVLLSLSFILHNEAWPYLSQVVKLNEISQATNEEA